MAMTTESIGRLSVAVVCRAELPAAINTTSSGPAPTAAFLVERTDHQELEPLDALLLPRGDHSADDFRELHGRLLGFGGVSAGFRGFAGPASKPRRNPAETPPKPYFFSRGCVAAVRPSGMTASTWS